jgi:hypothetical protein
MADDQALAPHTKDTLAMRRKNQLQDFLIGALPHDNPDAALNQFETNPFRSHVNNLADARQVE